MGSARDAGSQSTRRNLRAARTVMRSRERMSLVDGLLWLSKLVAWKTDYGHALNTLLDCRLAAGARSEKNR